MFSCRHLKTKRTLTYTTILLQAFRPTVVLPYRHLQNRKVVGLTYSLCSAMQWHALEIIVLQLKINVFTCILQVNAVLQSSLTVIDRLTFSNWQCEKLAQIGGKKRVKFQYLLLALIFVNIRECASTAGFAIFVRPHQIWPVEATATDT